MNANHALRLALLSWLGEQPRRYSEVMDAWRTTCPRMSIWEDAVLDGLIVIRRGPTKNESFVELSPAGRALTEA